MDLLTPGIGLIVWQVITLLALIFFIGAWVMILTDARWDNQRKLIWLLATFCLPILGALLYWRERKK